MKKKSSSVVLLAGGEEDMNLLSLLQAAKELYIPHQELLVGKEHHPRLHWDLSSDELFLNGQILNPTGFFGRYDVFAGMNDPRPEVQQRSQRWYATVSAWVTSHPEVSCLNRAPSPYVANKGATLKLAQDQGLAIPATWISNDLAQLTQLAEANRCVVKPIDGGDYCRTLPKSLTDLPAREGAAPAPAIVQTRMEQPEVRIYRIRDRLMAFKMKSNSLDYREKQDVDVTRIEVPAEGEDLVRLMDIMQMDYGAADFKTDPETGVLSFLEVNSSPMFAHFSYVSEGELARWIILALT